MIIVVEGTKQFNNYETFMRAMVVALSNVKNGNEIQVWSLGPHRVNSFTASFCNSSENFLKQKGYTISFSKVYAGWVDENLQFVDYYAFLSDPNESLSRLAQKAKDLEGCELGIFRY
jgi:hypothetical protein